MSLPTPEEFALVVQRLRAYNEHRQADTLNANYADAYALAKTQAKRIAELEAGIARCDANEEQRYAVLNAKVDEITAGVTAVIAERDAALSSLAELREAAEELVAAADLVTSKPTRGRYVGAHGALAEFADRCRSLATATPGRGEKLLAEREAFKDALLEALRYNVANIGTKDAFYVCSTPPKGVLPKWVNNALAALADLDADGATS